MKSHVQRRGKTYRYFFDADADPLTGKRGQLLIARRKRQLPRLHPLKQPRQRIHDLGNGLPERLGITGADIGRCHASPVQEGVKIRQTGTYPVQRPGREPLDEATRARLPAPEDQVMVSAVQAARAIRHRLQEVDPPHGPLDHDRPSRIHRTLQLAWFNQPYLKADTTLSPDAPICCA